MELTTTQWQIAHSIAITLVKKQNELDSRTRSGIRGEVEKVIAYLRYGQQRNLSVSLSGYLETLARQGNTIGHSRKTIDYYKALQATCEEYLARSAQDLAETLQILGWVKRLMQYYQEAVPAEELNNIEIISADNLPPERQAEIADVSSQQNFQIEQSIEALIAVIRGNQVTYEISGIRHSQKEPKHSKLFQEGQIVTVTILELRDDGRIKKVKYQS